MGHAGVGFQAPSPRANGRLPYGPHGARRKENHEHRAPERTVGSLAALMEHARRGIRAPSHRANGRLACGPHGARRKENHEHRAPKRTVSALRAPMEHARTGFLAPSLRAIGRLACDPHGACQGIGDFIRSSNASTVGWLLAKKITLCWAGAGRTIPASDRWPTGFAGDPRGVYLRCPSRSFAISVEAGFRSHGANQSQAGFESRT